MGHRLTQSFVEQEQGLRDIQRIRRRRVGALEVQSPASLAFRLLPVAPHLAVPANVTCCSPGFRSGLGDNGEKPNIRKTL